jgi:hypothetical protein
MKITLEIDNAELHEQNITPAQLEREIRSSVKDGDPDGKVDFQATETGIKAVIVTALPF